MSIVVNRRKMVQTVGITILRRLYKRKIMKRVLKIQREAVMLA